MDIVIKTIFGLGTIIGLLTLSIGIGAGSNDNLQNYDSVLHNARNSEVDYILTLLGLIMILISMTAFIIY